MIKKIVCGFAIILCLLLVSCKPTTGKNAFDIANNSGVDYFIIKATNGATFISL